ncbi:M1 family metallopeptidase [Kitasatospora sp. NBC_00240]|uniref:M1 family metallopeptidase n=1 Tax=Kitasatospora sp. NBC_00240 TaxID=2903567 RepID=UPI002256EDDE|nr:M1 family metallopeptidase [Kitasatospora sp. NBC_00240]MCX5213857.1 M1 family metallopeptidase [Kitasatospora sp. NBC_00240]
MAARGSDGKGFDQASTAPRSPAARRARRLRRALVPLWLVLALAASLGAPGAAAAEEGGAPTAGAAGLGDPLFPLDGNGGYEVRHYTLDFDWSAPRTAFPAVATVDAVATQSLSRFDLDFAGNLLGRVLVDGRPAATAREGDELVVTPQRAVRRGRPFSVRVEYTADPTQLRHRDDAIEDYGWIPTPDGTVLYPQPNGAKMIFPANDHPSRRAPFTFHITTPRDLTAVANGTLTGRREVGADQVRWSYESGQPMATQLVQVAIGRFTVLTGTGPGGLPLRDVIPTDLVDRVEPYRRLTPGHLAWLEQRLGRYPFGTYGVLAAHTDLGVALETQTLSLLPEADLLGSQVDAERDLVHELAHQWFGDSVGLKAWSDLWLSEGHARFYERLYSEEHGGVNFEQTMRAAYQAHDLWRRDYGAPAAPTEPALFKRMRYDGSALVLFALREQVGDPAFRAVERAWVERYRDRPAGTADYVELASRITGQDLRGFLTAWLYGDHTPPMPGHPDWTVDRVPAGAAAGS